MPTRNDEEARVRDGSATAITRRSLLTIGAAVAARVSSVATAQSTVVTLGQISLTFHAVAGAVVHETLERLGHEVVLREGAHERMFPLLGVDAVDLMATAWLPGGHAGYWRQYGSRSMEVATLYEGARFFWAVPSYVPASDVASITDLAHHPEHRLRRRDHPVVSRRGRRVRSGTVRLRGACGYRE
jgi:glycine betaine/proline transport system substrate-binding protein